MVILNTTTLTVLSVCMHVREKTELDFLLKIYRVRFWYLVNLLCVNISVLLRNDTVVLESDLRDLCSSINSSSGFNIVIWCFLMKITEVIYLWRDEFVTFKIKWNFSVVWIWNQISFWDTYINLLGILLWNLRVRNKQIFIHTESRIFRNAAVNLCSDGAAFGVTFSPKLLALK